MARKQRRRTPHSGVKVIRWTVEGVTRWVARWRERDPTTGRQRWRQVTLSTLGVTSEPQRVAWAKAKAGALRKAEELYHAGRGPKAEAPWTVDRAIEDYLSRARERLRPTTTEGYTRSLELFRAWSEKTGIETLPELSEYSLGSLRDWLQARRRTASKRNGRRGARRATSRTVDAVTSNHDLLRVRIFLRDARRLGRLPNVDREKISESLKGRRAAKRIPKFLRPAEVRELLKACLRHDAQTFSMTREEKAAGGAVGETPRYRPVAPFVLFLLLSGVRLLEGLSLRWRYCHLVGDAPEIILPAETTKTSTDRSVDLVVSPSLARLLGALRLGGEGEYVFGGNAALSRTWLQAARRRLIREFGAPDWSPQILRATCASVLACAPGIYGTAGIFLESRRLGHSVAIAEARYAGTLRDLPRHARTIEAALGIEDSAARIVAAAGRVQGGGEMEETDRAAVR